MTADVTTTLARIRQRGGDLGASRAAVEQVVEQARDSGDVGAELRGLHHLGALDFERGRLADAVTVYQRGAARAREAGLTWSPYGLDARVLAGLAAYQTGDWTAATRIVDVAGESPPGMAEAALASVTLCVAAGRGDGTALEVLSAIRPWWGSDGMIAILSGGAAIDLHGDTGDLAGASSAYDDVVGFVEELWRRKDFAGKIRLSGLLLGHQAAQAHRSGRRSGPSWRGAVTSWRRPRPGRLLAPARSDGSAWRRMPGEHGYAPSICACGG